MTLSIVHFSTADGEGGSARSAHRIHSALRRRGHRSRMLVKYRVLEDEDVDTVAGSDRLLPRLGRRAPIVWRLSDMWPMTGHCAYAGSCERWQAGCGRCPDLASYPAIGLDTTGFLWRQKRRLYRNVPITVARLTHPGSRYQLEGRFSP